MGEETLERGLRSDVRRASCPAWCAVPEAEHADELAEPRGTCHHESRDPDFTRGGEPADVHLSRETWFDGTPVEPDVIDLNGCLYTLDEAERTAEHLLKLVRAARSS